MTDLARLSTDHVLRDGTTLHVRPPRPGDAARVRAFWDRLSPDTVRARFGGGVGPRSRWIDRLLGAPDPEHQVTRVVTTGRGDDERIVALAQLVRLDDPGSAEFAALVEDAWQGRGVGTVLLRELAAHAVGIGVERLVGDVFADNVRMLRVIRDLGLVAEQRLDGPYIHATFEVAPTDAVLAAMDRQDAEAARHAVDRFLHPAAVAVVGPLADPDSTARAVLANLRTGGYPGPVTAVDPTTGSVAASPTVPELVVVATGPAGVPAAVDDAGGAGTRAVVVLTDLDPSVPAHAAAETEMLAIARGYGLRLLGPGSAGVLGSRAGARVHALAAPVAPPPGQVALAAASAPLALAVLARATERGVGLAAMASPGDGVDVGVEDLLLAWGEDPDVTVVALVLSSLADPRRFVRLARRISRTTPVVVLHAGPTSDTEAALFRQAGVIRVDTVAALLDVASLLARTPSVTGRRVAVLATGAGPAALAVGAASGHGLVPTRVDGDLDLDRVGEAAATLAASDEVDALVVVVAPVFPEDGPRVSSTLASGLAAVAATVPVVVALLGTRPTPVAPTVPRLLTVAAPDDAMRALRAAAIGAEVRGRAAGVVVRPVDVDRAASDAVVAAARAARPDGGLLPTAATASLLRAHGITVARARVVGTPHEVAEAQADLATAVAVKAAVPGIRKRDVDAVRLDLTSPVAAATAARAIGRALDRAGLAAPADPYLVQEMVTDGVEVSIAVRDDGLFGPVLSVVVGDDTAAHHAPAAVRLVPVTDVDVDDLLATLPDAWRLTGEGDGPAMDVAALRDLLFRVSALVEAAPAVDELLLDPVFVRRRGVAVVDARVRLAPVGASVP